MSKFFHHTIKPKPHPSTRDPSGFHAECVYKILNKSDKSVMQVEWEDQDGKKVCRIVTDESADTDHQLFLATRAGEEKGKHEHQFVLKSVVQMDGDQIWDYKPHLKTLTQTPPHKVWNRLWFTYKKQPGSRFIKATADDLCLTNMGRGKPIALLPIADHDARQWWVLEKQNTDAEHAE